MANLPRNENLDGILIRNVFVFQLIKGVIGSGADPCRRHAGAQSKTQTKTGLLAPPDVKSSTSRVFVPPRAAD